MVALNLIEICDSFYFVRKEGQKYIGVDVDSSTTVEDVINDLQKKFEVFNYLYKFSERDFQDAIRNMREQNKNNLYQKFLNIEIEEEYLTAFFTLSEKQHNLIQ